MAAWIRISRIAFAAALLVPLSACGDSPSSPSAPLELTGTWSGLLGQPGSTSALRVTWTATQTGNVVSGVATIVKPMFNIEGRGAMTGILDGDRLVLTYAVPPDSIAGFPRCEIAGIGSAVATNASITGAIALTFSSCGGTGLEPPGRSDLRLAK